MDLAALPRQFAGLPEEAQRLAAGILDAASAAGVYGDAAIALARTGVRRIYREHEDTGAWSKRPDNEVVWAYRFAREDAAAGEPLRLNGADAFDLDATTKQPVKATWNGVEYVVGKPIQICREGVFANHPGKPKLDFSAAKLVQAIANCKGEKRHVALDYNHGTLTMGPEAVAAGIVLSDTLEHRPGMGLYGRPYYTAKAAEGVASGEWTGISPLWSANAESFERPGEFIGPMLYGAALCNVPHQAGMEPIAGLEMFRAALSAAHSHSTPTEEDMSKLLDALNVKDEAAALTALTALQANAAGLDKLAATLGVDATPDALSKAIDGILADKTALSAQVATLTTEADALKAEAKGKAVDEAVMSALAAGKLVKAQEAWAKGYAAADLVGFNAFVAAAPKIVALNVAHGVDGNGTEGEVDVGGEPTRETAQAALSKAAADCFAKYGASHGIKSKADAYGRLSEFPEFADARAAYGKAFSAQ